MKRNFNIPLTILSVVLFAACAIAGVPLKWDVDTSKTTVKQFAAWNGETLDLEATLCAYRSAIDLTGKEARIYWQTNGMGYVYWQTNATVVASNVLAATFTPHMNPGARAIMGFIGVAGEIYRAAFSIRFNGSPGATPHTIELPVKVLDFAKIEVLNPPWPDAATVTNIVLDVAPAPGNYAAVSNAAMSAASRSDLAAATNGIPRVAESGANPGYAANADWAHQADIAYDADWAHQADTAYDADYASYAGFAYGLRGAAGERTPDAIFAQLDAATETNAQQSAALASQASQLSQQSQSLSTIGSQVNSIGAQLNAIPTRAALDEGWWSEWTFSNVSASITDIQQPVFHVDYWSCGCMYSGELLFMWIEDAKETDTRLDFSFTAGGNDLHFTATRHRVAAPVPTKPEDIGAASTADATLAPVLGEWTILRAGVDVTSQVRRPEWDEEWDEWFVSVLPSDESPEPTISGMADASSLKWTAYDPGDDFNLVTYTATRSLIGYTLGSQTNKVIAATNGVLRTESDPTVSAWAKAESKPTYTSSEVGAYPNASGEQLASQVNSIGAHLNAEDAHFVSTNYDSVVHIPEAYVEIKMSNSWITIWREMTRWDRFVGSAFDWTAWNGFHAFQTHVTTELAFKADRAWGVYDSETGGYSPEGYTQISSSNILIAAGMAYQRTVTSAGSVWVLQCNSGAATIGGDTNGFFRVIDGDGNTQFEIVKGDRREMGADASGITVSAGNVMSIPYSVESAEHPTISCCNNIATANWKDETDADCLCSVSWSGTSGAWVATVTPKTAQPSMFVKATFMAGGETYIRNLAPVSMDAIVIRGVKYYLGTAVISGHTVLTLSTTPPSP